MSNIQPFNKDDLDVFGLEGGLDMDIFADYTEFDVDKNVKSLAEQSKSLVQSVLDLHLQSQAIETNTYLEAMVKVETSTLSSLFLLAESCQHVLKTLLTQMDNGALAVQGSALINDILSVMKQSMEITLKVSQYTRNLPTYINFAIEDMNAVGLLIEESKETVASELVEDSSTPVDKYANSEDKFMGTANLIKQLQKEVDDAKKHNEEHGYVDTRKDESGEIAFETNPDEIVEVEDFEETVEFEDVTGEHEDDE